VRQTQHAMQQLRDNQPRFAARNFVFQ
jgi:hypothetical protein